MLVGIPDDLLNFALSVDGVGARADEFMQTVCRALVNNSIETRTDLIGLEFKDLDLEDMEPKLAPHHLSWIRRAISQINEEFVRSLEQRSATNLNQGNGGAIRALVDTIKKGEVSRFLRKAFLH